MKTFVHSVQVKAVFVTVFFLPMLSQLVFAQAWTALQQVGGGPSDIIQYQYGQMRRLGIGPGYTNGIDQPQAIFHQRDYLHSFPMAIKEAIDENENPLCTIKFIFNDYENEITYGIQQLGSDFTNLFEGSIGSSRQLFLKGANTSFLVMGEGIFPFSMTTSPSSQIVTPLTLYRNLKVQVRDTLECNNFKLNFGAGGNKILLSDEQGNGFWTDPMGLNDHKWLINDDRDLYASPDRNHVGIGFPTSHHRIFQRLHVVDGNIMISRVNGGNPCSLNGSILFADNLVDDDNPNGQWGIEYYNDGLNFWKVYNRVVDSPNTTEDDFYNYRLFLRDDGNVGIGCKNTQGFKLAVKGGVLCDNLGIGTEDMEDTRGYKLAVKGNILCEEVLIRKYLNWPDFVFDENYSLLSLYELEAFTKVNKHLPEMPTARDVQNNGMNIGDISAALLKKVEELTRYIIEQQKQIDDLKSKVENR